jgi:hypothetical protein
MLKDEIENKKLDSTKLTHQTCNSGHEYEITS